MSKYQLAFISVLLLFTPFLSVARDLPLWEAGLGLAGLALPDYRGSDRSSAYLLPLPYITYRGERLNVDDAGVHGLIFQSERINLDLSLAGGVPVPKSNQGVRQGMPGLDPTVEFGPSLEFWLYRPASGERSLWLRLPFRSVIAVDLGKTSHQGWSFSPYLEYTLYNGAHRPHDWRKLSISIGPLFADQAYHEYFYDVASPYATPERPEYHARGGYSGSRITLTWQRRLAQFWLAGFARYDSLEHAVFEDSPLVASKRYYAVGLGISWIFAESKRVVTTQP